MADGPAPGERIRLVVLFGGQSAEHDVSCVTASHVLAAADPQRYAVQPVGITKQVLKQGASDAPTESTENAHVNASLESVAPPSLVALLQRLVRI